MRILVTNDDGIYAPGLAVLEEIAATLSDDIWVVAPQEEQSGAGHSLTLTQPIRVRRYEARRFAVRGTPTDCVMMALGKLIDGPKPDLILSGVNRGNNLGEDVTYSGTVSAAMEGTLARIRSVALSQETADQPVGTDAFAAARKLAPGILAHLVAQPWPDGVLININFPARLPADICGVHVVRQGFRDYSGLQIIERTDVRGFPYYWFGLSRTEEASAAESDIRAVRDGYVAITPLHLDLTHDRSLAGLAQAFAGFALPGPIS